MIIGDFSAQLYGDYVINHEIRIPIKQPVFRRKVRDPVFFLMVHFPELHSRFTAEGSNRTTMLFGVIQLYPIGCPRKFVNGL